MKLEIGMTLLLSYTTHNLQANEHMVTSQMAAPSLELLQFLGEWQDDNGQFVEPELLDSESIQTHLNGELPQEEMEDPWATHPDQLLIEATAGTVVIFNSHTWHGGTTNSSNDDRRSIHSYFCRADQPQQTDQKKFIQAATLNRLSAASKMLLGV